MLIWAAKGMSGQRVNLGAGVAYLDGHRKTCAAIDVVTWRLGDPSGSHRNAWGGVERFGEP